MNKFVFALGQRDLDGFAALFLFFLDVIGENETVSVNNGAFLLVISHNKTNIHKKETQIAIASDKIIGNLTARTRAAGDRILMGGVHKSLKKLMCDKKIPQSLRDTLPIICDSEGILYVPYIGLRDGTSAKNSENKTYISLIIG